MPRRRRRTRRYSGFNPSAWSWWTWGLLGGGLLGVLALVFRKQVGEVATSAEQAASRIAMQGASLLRKKGLDQKLLDFLDACETQLGFMVGIPQYGGVRSTSDVTALYAQGRTAPGKIVTNAADPTQTAHYYGLAVDVAPYDSVKRDFIWDDAGKFAQIGALAKSMGLVWGGDWTSFKDLPHVEVADWVAQRDSGRAPALAGIIELA